MIVKYLKRFLFKVFTVSPIVLLISFFAFVSLGDYAFLLNFDQTQKAVALAIVLTTGWVFGAINGWLMTVDSILSINHEAKNEKGGE